MKLRVGIGYDVHKLVQGRRLIIGGVEIENCELGALGHSDADCLIHAIIDALLGAANLRDIGYHFPDSNIEYKDADSRILLRKTLEKINEKGFTIENIDSTVCLQRPKIGKYVNEMKRVIAEILQMDEDDVSIKATTTEMLGFTGRSEGIAAYSVCLLKK